MPTEAHELTMEGETSTGSQEKTSRGQGSTTVTQNPDSFPDTETMDIRTSLMSLQLNEKVMMCGFLKYRTAKIFTKTTAFEISFQKYFFF